MLPLEEMLPQVHEKRAEGEVLESAGQQTALPKRIGMARPVPRGPKFRCRERKIGQLSPPPNLALCVAADLSGGYRSVV